MKHVVWIAVILSMSATLVACDNARIPSAAVAGFPDGSYSGTYTRIDRYSGDDPVTTTGDVRLTFDKGAYTIEGASRYVPPRGHGTVRCGPVVTFQDAGFHTAEFDRNLIIQGEFQVSRVDGRLALEQFDASHDRLVRIVVDQYEGVERASERAVQRRER